MQEIAVLKFKATCLSVVDQVQKTKKPVRITKFGKPVAQVVPISEPPKKKFKLGWGIGTGEILGDIVGPSTNPEEWDALR